jgi:CheY-like chemotaxis protein
METAENIKILIVGAVPTDAELIEQTLRGAGLSFVAQRVGTQAAFIRALEEFNPDIVLSDCKLPDFDGLAAIEHARRIREANGAANIGRTCKRLLGAGRSSGTPSSSHEYRTRVR